MGKHGRTSLFLCIVLGFVGFSALSCGRKQILFAVDQYWSLSGQFSPQQTKELEKTAVRLGADLHIVTIPYGEAAEDLIEINRNEIGADLVILSPIFAPLGESIREKSPELRIAAITLSGHEDAAGELIVNVVIDREKAFTELGSELCEFSRLNDDAVIHGIWFIGTEVKKKEYQTFYDAFIKGCSADNLDIMLIESADSTVINDYVKSLPDGSGTIGLAFTSGATADYLETFAQKGMGVASEYLMLEDFNNGMPLYSVSFPLQGIIEQILQDPKDTKKSIKVDSLLLKRE